MLFGLTAEVLAVESLAESVELEPVFQDGALVVRGVAASWAGLAAWSGRLHAAMDGVVP